MTRGYAIFPENNNHTRENDMMHVSSARLLRTLLQCTLLGVVMLFATGPAFATVYKCVDADEHVAYSSEPCGKQAQEVNAPISVTPPFVAPEASATQSGLLDKLGLGGTEAVTGLLFALIPISLLAMFVLSRKSQNAK